MDEIVSDNSCDILTAHFAKPKSEYSRQTSYIVTTRFDETTWEYNSQYRSAHDITGCLYSDQMTMSSKVPIGSPVFVVEMNNSQNRIEGIGLIRNRLYFEKTRIYSEINYNRYIYCGKHRLGRDELLSRHVDLVETLDAILFKGKTHMKRGSGYTRITEKIMALKRCVHLNLLDEIITLFQEVYKVI
jgi:hypothetical protein